MARLPASANFLAPIVAETLLDRLAMVTREFPRTLLIGAHDGALADQLRTTDTTLTIIEAGPRLAATSGAIAVEADAIDLPFASFDLIVWPGGLDSVNDVPGALVRLRALLTPDGLLLGAFVGDGSLPRLRRAVMADGVRSVARLHPQIDLAAMGNLLQRVGFTMPVVDVEALTVRYGDLAAPARAAAWRDTSACAPAAADARGGGPDRRRFRCPGRCRWPDRRKHPDRPFQRLGAASRSAATGAARTSGYRVAGAGA